MSQTNSNYERKDHELYPTPRWVTQALMRHMDLTGGVWECAAGEGMMANELDKLPEHAAVFRSDIRPCDGLHWVGNFLQADHAHRPNIVTNPPYGKGGKLAEQFIEHALRLTLQRQGQVAMLLRVDFDSAKTRMKIFGDHLAFSRKIVLTSRIKWFEGPAGPSENHAWYIWDWKHDGGPPTIGYAGRAA